MDGTTASPLKISNSITDRSTDPSLAASARLVRAKVLKNAGRKEDAESRLQEVIAGGADKETAWSARLELLLLKEKQNADELESWLSHLAELRDGMVEELGGQHKLVSQAEECLKLHGNGVSATGSR